MNSMGPLIGAAGLLVFTQAFNALAPVAVDMRFKDMTRADEYVEGHVYGRKIKDCSVVSGSYVGWQKAGGVWKETPFLFIDDPSPDSTRPNSWDVQDFGIWRWDDVDPSATDVRMTLQHNCNGHLEVTAVKFSVE